MLFHNGDVIQAHTIQTIKMKILIAESEEQAVAPKRLGALAQDRAKTLTRSNKHTQALIKCKCDAGRRRSRRKKCQLCSDSVIQWHESLFELLFKMSPAMRGHAWITRA